MRNVIVLVAVTAGLTSCGSSSSKQATTSNGPASTTASATTTAPQAAQPVGKLSASEYGQIHGAMLELAKLDKLHGDKALRKTLKIGRPACSKTGTETDLLAQFHSTCVQSFRFVSAAQRLFTHKAECTQAAQAGDISCWSDLFRSLGRSARVTVIRQQGLNGALRKRGIKGRCANAIGSTNKDIRSGHAVVHDSLSAAHALEARDKAAFLRATHRLDHDLNSGDGNNSADKALRDVATCRG